MENKDIYSYATEMVKRGERFRVDFKKRTLKIGRRAVLDGGVPAKGFCIYSAGGFYDDPLTSIKRMHFNYYHSVPSARSERNSRAYFAALPEERLEITDMMFGMARELARCRLEVFTLLAITLGTLKWDESTMGRWFWRSPDAPGLILMRDWVEPTFTRHCSPDNNPVFTKKKTKTTKK